MLAKRQWPPFSETAFICPSDDRSEGQQQILTGCSNPKTLQLFRMHAVRFRYWPIWAKISSSCLNPLQQTSPTLTIPPMFSWASICGPLCLRTRPTQDCGTSILVIRMRQPLYRVWLQSRILCRSRRLIEVQLIWLLTGFQSAAFGVWSVVDTNTRNDSIKGRNRKYISFERKHSRHSFLIPLCYWKCL